MIQQNLNINQFQVGRTVPTPIQNYPERRFKLTKILREGRDKVIFLAESVNWLKKAQYYVLKIHKIPQKEEYIQFIDNLIDYQNSYDDSVPSQLIRTYEQFFIQEKQLVIIMEFGGQSLYEAIQNNMNIDSQMISNYCIQMAHSIDFLQSNNLIHRDIKPENYVIDGQYIKLIDFQLITKNNLSKKITKIGTPLCSAPELVQGRDDYTGAVDVWSLGCVIYEFINKLPLFNFKEIRQIENQILNHLNNQQYVYEKINSLQISEAWKQIILQMLNPIPQNRPNIKHVSDCLQNNNIASYFSTTNVISSNCNNSLNQNVLYQIINLIQTFQDSSILTQLQSNSEAKQYIDKLIDQLNQVLGKCFTPTKQNIQDKINQVDQLISEIEKDKEYQDQKQVFLPKFLEIYAKKEIMLQNLEIKLQKQQEFNNIENQINSEQKLKEELAIYKQKIQNLETQNNAMLSKKQDLKSNLDLQRMNLTRNYQVIQEISIDQQIKNQQQQLINLKIELNKSIYWENIFKQNVAKIELLEKEIAGKQNFAQQINQQTSILVELELECEKIVEYQKKHSVQQQEIQQLQIDIAELKQKGEHLAEKEQEKKYLNIQMSYLKQEILKLENQEKNFDEELSKYKDELKQYEEKKDKQNKLLQEIQETIKQLTLNKIQLEQDYALINQRELQKNNLNQEIENKKKAIQMLSQQKNDVDVQILVEQLSQLDLKHQQVIQQQNNSLFQAKEFTLTSQNQQKNVVRQNQPAVQQPGLFPPPFLQPSNNQYNFGPPMPNYQKK